MKRFIIRDREAGNEIEEANTLEEAYKIITNYEEQDKLDDIYEENFYEIYDTIYEAIVE